MYGLNKATQTLGKVIYSPVIEINNKVRVWEQCELGLLSSANWEGEPSRLVILLGGSFP